MKRVLSIQDLSCLGRCSMTVTIPTLSAMGIQCIPLPTAVLSSHTAFPDPHVRDLTEDIAPIAAHWQSIGADFDAICVGYLSDPMQAAAVEKILNAFPAKVVIDPVLGDHGRCYRRITDQHISAMKTLCQKADVLLPNVTEACLLTGIAYKETEELSWYTQLLQAVKALGAKAVVLTGVGLEANQLGCMGTDGREEFAFQLPKVPKSSHGTGDLFTAIVTGELTRGSSLSSAARRAGEFVAQTLSQLEETSPFGLPLEAMLPSLWK